jgi:ABC-type antimicrobial peptide transport system permease subunit
MRKVVGAQRIDIIKQFLGESVVLTLMAFILAIALVELFMPIFNNLSGKELTFEFFSNIYITFGIAGIIILTALLSGSYPALFLSSFKPVNILKGSNLDASSKSSFRKGLVMFQFTITVILFVGTISVYKQLNYMQNKELGYEKDCIIYMPLVGDLHEKYKLIKSELLRNPNILNATVSSQSMMGIEVSTTDVDWEGKNPEDKISMCVASVDYDYFDTFKMKIIQGRKFSKKISTDDSSAYIINEAAAKVMGMKSPIEKQFTLWSNEGYIIGVVKDYHFHSLQYVLEPLVIRIAPDYTYYLCAKIASDNIPKTIKFLETVWGKFVPEFPFEYHFLDQSLDKLYRNEQRLGVIFKYFSAVAIIISCLGLFGLSSFMTEQRTKEIGIRKVLGATVSGIVYLLTKEFTVLVLIANIIAWPVAYYAMSRWLRGFAYRINIELLTFVMAAALALVIALITVSYHALKAAYANPIEALRYE